MTVATPAFLQTQTYDAIVMRYLLQAFVTEGVGTGADLLVTQRAAGANMSVDIAAGRGWVQGDDVARQGVYHVVNDATVNVSVGTAHATLPRIDRVVLRVRDSTAGIPGDSATLEIVAGTATSGATLSNLNGAAAVPPSALLLANVLVGAAATSVATGQIGNVATQSTSVGAARSISFAPVSSATWTNMPAALTELFGGQQRTAFDLTSMSQARLVCNLVTAGAATAVLRAQYSTNSGSSWSYLDGATGPQVALSAAGVPVSPWVNLAAGAKADVQLRIIGINGDGAADPVINGVGLQVR